MGRYPEFTQAINLGNTLRMHQSAQPGSLLLLIVGAYLWTRVSRIPLFWAAFLLTRQLGAVVGDFLDKPIAQGGMALSRYTATAVLLSLIIVGIALQTRGTTLAQNRAA